AAAARHAAEDAAQHRGPRSRARSRPRPVDDGEALPRALDERADRMARAAAAAAPRVSRARRRSPRRAARCRRASHRPKQATQRSPDRHPGRARRGRRHRRDAHDLSRYDGARMLIASVVAYLAITIGIGLWAAKRVHNSKDYLVAGRKLPLYMSAATVFATWFGAETVLSVSATFTRDGLGGVVADPF